METTRQKIERLGTEYSQDKTVIRGFIRKDWMEKLEKEFNVKSMTDYQLAEIWDMIYLTTENKINEYNKEYKNCINELKFRKDLHTPLKGKSLEQTITYYEKEKTKYFELDNKWRDVKSAFLEVVNSEARSRN